MKWPVVFMLMFTSVPAGFVPFMAAGAYRSMKYQESLSPRRRNERVIKSNKSMITFTLLASAGAMTIQLLMSWLAWRNWNNLLLGFRGAAWFVLMWAALAVGVGLGIWIYSVAPD
jgi:hypothetical protein